MKLQSEGRPAIRAPQSTDVHVAVSELALPSNSFLILSRSPTSFVQVAIQPGERFVIEYPGGTGVFRSERDDFSRDEIARVLDSYLSGGDAWRAGIQWRPTERPRDGWDTVGKACMFASFACFLLAGFSLTAAGASETDPMVPMTIGAVLLAISSAIDMRDYKQMNATHRMRTTAPFFVAVLMILYWVAEAIWHPKQ